MTQFVPSGFWKAPNLAVLVARLLSMPMVLVLWSTTEGSHCLYGRICVQHGLNTASYPVHIYILPL